MVDDNKYFITKLSTYEIGKVNPLIQPQRVQRPMNWTSIFAKPRDFLNENFHCPCQDSSAFTDGGSETDNRSLIGSR